MIMKTFTRKSVVLILTVMLSGHVSGADETAGGAQTDEKLCASVGSVQITDAEYNLALQQASRKKFYHCTPPEGAMDL